MNFKVRVKVYSRRYQSNELEVTKLTLYLFLYNWEKMIKRLPVQNEKQDLLFEATT